MKFSTRIVAAIATAGALFLGVPYFFALSPRLHPWSADGARGFVLYLFGDYLGAAVAYRAHYEKIARANPVGDPMWNALLAGNLATARTLAKTDRGYSRAALLTLAEIALREGQPDDALRLAAHVLERDRDQFDALLLVAVAHSQLGAWSPAIDALQRALRQGRIESRITSFLWALETTGRLTRLPGDQRPLCVLAHWHRYLRIFDPWEGWVAIRFAEQAIAAGDRPADAFVTIGIVRDKQGKPQATFEALTKALEIEPRNAEALRWAAKSYSERGEVASELRLLERAAEAAPDDSFYLAPLLYVLTEKVGDFQQARQRGERALQAGLEDVDLRSRLGYVHYSLGNYETSLAHYVRVVALEPGRAQAHQGMGWALQALGRTRDALAAFERAVQLGPYGPDNHLALARAYQRARRHREAIAAYERGVQIAMRGGNANFWDVKELCGLYQRVGELERAESCLQRLDAIQPGVGLVHRRLAQIRENLRAERAGR